MPRSNPSGGPWGSGPQGPPDLEEFFKDEARRIAANIAKLSELSNKLDRAARSHISLKQ